MIDPITLTSRELEKAIEALQTLIASARAEGRGIEAVEYAEELETLNKLYSDQLDFEYEMEYLYG
jgi:hypothetical protein